MILYIRGYEKWCWVICICVIVDSFVSFFEYWVFLWKVEDNNVCILEGL